MSKMSNPRYVELPGNTVARIPYLARKATIHAMFFVSNSKSSLQRVCDRALNDRVGCPLRFHVNDPVVAFTALYADQMTSDDPIDKSKGYVKEADIGLSILVQGGEADRPETWEDYLLPVYMFVDSGAALSAGREVFGYPKLLGRFERESEVLDNDARVTVHTQHFAKFGPDEEALVAPLFAIERVPEPPPSVAQYPETQFAQGPSGRLFARMIRPPRRALDLTAFGDDGLTMVFLKQFRDLTRPSDACYQAITSVDMIPVTTKPEEDFSDAYSLRLWESDSHPIASDLGLTCGQKALTEFRPFQTELSFTVGFGSMLWQWNGGGAST
jgi:hypothetical protein